MIMNEIDITNKYNSEELKLASFNPAARVIAATGMAQMTSTFLERKYLSGGAFFSCKEKTFGTNVVWLKVSRIGSSTTDKPEDVFIAIQKILQACFLPKAIQLLFLLDCEAGVCSLYLGLRIDGNSIDRDFVTRTGNFAESVWPGLQFCKPKKNEIEKISARLRSEDPNERCDSIWTVTGIPSMESLYKSTYPGTIDKLIAGMNGVDFSYLIIADPVSESDIDSILCTCRELCGQAESVKSFNYSECKGIGYSESNAHTDGETKNAGIIDTKTIALAIGTLLTFVAPGALPLILPLFEAENAFEQLFGISLINSILPKKESGMQTSDTKTLGFSTNQSNTISQNIVNKHIESLVEYLQFHAKRFEQGKAFGCWNVSAFLLGKIDNDAKYASLQLKSILSGQESIYEPIRIHDLNNVVQGNVFNTTIGVFEKPEINILIGDKEIQHPFGAYFNKLSTLLTTKELSCYVNFPLKSVPGISVVDSFPSFNLTKQVLKKDADYIPIGNLLWGGASTKIDINLPIDTLSRHSLVVGVNGSGKTNTVLSVLDGLANKGRAFMVVEPAKTEYVDWALQYNAKIREYNKSNPNDKKKEIKIFIPGCGRYINKDAKAEQNNYFIPDILGINPFEVINLGGNEPRTLSHIDRLKATFASAFPMQDILPVVMEHLLYLLYDDKKDLLNPANAKSMDFPQIRDVNDDLVDELMMNLGYAKENTQNISAALRTRFNSLMYGWKKDLLDNKTICGKIWDDEKNEYVNSSLSWDDLFGSPCVINLSYAGDDQDRAFIMSLLLQFLYEYRIAETEKSGYSFSSNKCKHLVVVEEAHRIMAKCDNPELPQYKSGQMFSNFLSEVRAYGQGMMIVDQVPSRLIEDAIKNTNIKIIHKLVAADDASQIAECIGLTDDQKKVIAKLSVGQAILAGFNSTNIRSGDSSDIFLAQINPMK